MGYCAINRKQLNQRAEPLGLVLLKSREEIARTKQGKARFRYYFYWATIDGRELEFPRIYTKAFYDKTALWWERNLKLAVGADIRYGDQ